MSRPSCCTATDSSSDDHRMLLPENEFEFEAAEALAGLSKPPSSREASGGGESSSADSWGSSRTKRSTTVDVNTESSPLLDSGKKPVLLAFDLNEDQATTFSQNQGAAFSQEEGCQRGPKELVQAEDAELAEPSPACTTSQTGGKPRHNLTEADKEARRLRRVLANRESARQTIRRRQALYEELTRKVADLARENENLKRDKKSAVQVYHALKCTNKKLNEQVAEHLGSKLEENRGKTTSNSSVPPLPFPNYPYIICKDTPYACPYNIQLPDHMNPTQPSQYGFTRQSEANLSKASNSESHTGKAEPLSINGSSGHWCMVPCPLFFPVPDVKNGPNLIPLFPAETCVDYQHAGTSSSKLLSCPKNISSEFPIDVKKEISSLVEARPGTTLCDTPLGLSLDLVNEQLTSQPKRVGVELTNVTSSEAIFSKGFPDVNVLQASHQESAVILGKRLVDPAAAAEARKRRKELTRLKSLHCRVHRKEGPRLGESHPSLPRNG